MARLSDRAFQIIKNEIERQYSNAPSNQQDQIERAILLSRLETLRSEPGKPMTRVQLWEILSDIAPNFDQNVLMDAESVETDPPLAGISVGVGAVAVLVAAAMGMKHLTVARGEDASIATTARITGAWEQQPAKQGKPVAAKSSDSFQKATQRPIAAWNGELPQLFNLFSVKPNTDANSPEDTVGQSQPATTATTRSPGIFSRFRNNPMANNAFEKAQELGWQAALRSQNPPYSSQHWGKTEEMWRQAIAHLNQVPPYSNNYTAAQLKKKTYQKNLQEIQKQYAIAIQREHQRGQLLPTVVPSADSTPQFSASSPAGLQSPAAEAPAEASPEAPPEDPLKIAKNYGWQAALASQNAPHPPEKWADISRLWRSALLVLSGIDPAHPSYAEAQQVKARYQQNLNMIRDRYQQEQAATQRLRSLQANLTELNNSTTPSAAKYSQLEAIVTKLQTIPPGTQAHKLAQPLIGETMGSMRAIAATATVN